jgi:uncharacterized protein (DUF849 family)
MSHSVVVTVAPNGARRGKSDHPAIPLTPMKSGGRLPVAGMQARP